MALLGFRTRWCDEAGVRALAARLTALTPELVVLEATGGYELLAAGKAKQLALVACMRKLLTMLNAMVAAARRGATTPVSLGRDFQDSC